MRVGCTLLARAASWRSLPAAVGHRVSDLAGSLARQQRWAAPCSIICLKPWSKCLPWERSHATQQLHSKPVDIRAGLQQVGAPAPVRTGHAGWLIRGRVCRWRLCGSCCSSSCAALSPRYASGSSAYLLCFVGMCPRRCEVLPPLGPLNPKPQPPFWAGHAQVGASLNLASTHPNPPRTHTCAAQRHHVQSLGLPGVGMCSSPAWLTDTAAAHHAAACLHQLPEHDMQGCA